MHGEISEDEFDLHSIMYLLILSAIIEEHSATVNLHSIMYLLIHEAQMKDEALQGFTFHNVSINSLLYRLVDSVHPHLHSIMYLLIRNPV